MQPLVLDLDRSVAALRDEHRIDLRHLERSIRYSCWASDLRRLGRVVDAEIGRRSAIAFLGSGDFHHVSLALIARLRACGPLEVVVFDNHPDNMRFVAGVHCGSWVRSVARLPHVSMVHVVGITSVDVAGRHILANYLQPLRRGKLRYWCVGVDTWWARKLGVERAVTSFATAGGMLDGFTTRPRARSGATYVSIDKDVLHTDAVMTNWDQGVLRDDELLTAIESVGGRMVGGDVTGDISPVAHPGAVKRLLSALDGQAEVDPLRLPHWQAQHRALNELLFGALGRAYAA